MNWSQELSRIKPDDAKDFVLGLVSLKLSCPTLIFRGISRADQRYPSLMRVSKDKGRFNCWQKERIMLERFYQKAAHLIPGSSDALHFVSCAQHYGIPTRLIDWTDDPLVALFFAISGPGSDDGDYRILICDSKRQLELSQIYSRTTWAEAAVPSSASQIDQFFGFCDCIKNEEGINTIVQRAKVKSSDGFILLRPGFSNERIRAQKGLFVIPKSHSRKKIDNEYKAAGVAELRIPTTQKESLRHCLLNLGVTRDLLFGDLESIALMVKSEALR